MKFEGLQGKKKIFVECLDVTGNQEFGYNGKFVVTNKKDEILDEFVHYIPPTENMEDEFFNKVSKLPRFKNSIRI